MVLYRDIIIKNDHEEFRLVRLKKLVDEIYNLIPIDYIVMIKKLVDIKGELNVYWKEKPSNFYKMIINSMWMDLYEFNVNHIIIDDDNFCPHCNAPPQKEDPEIKAYLDSYNLNYII
jgi:hypothetical protein